MLIAGTIAVALVAAAVVYFLSSGVAFALMYRVGERFPSRAVGTLYEPLEWLSRRSTAFRSLYNGLHVRCYRLFVGELVNGWVPPPPSLARQLEHESKEDGRQ
jgi:hypothetical protein